ncbi:unnamed protein product [Choristocarpus tenellus]
MRLANSRPAALSLGCQQNLSCFGSAFALRRRPAYIPANWCSVCTAHSPFATSDISGHEGDLQWPWVLVEPGRYTELPSEELFGGFAGLDGLEDDEPLFESQPYTDACDLDNYKVSRDVRGACHTPVILDHPPAPRLVALSERGAALTGLSSRHGRIGMEGQGGPLPHRGRHSEGMQTFFLVLWWSPVWELGGTARRRKGCHPG